jgi:hypothetical protein
MRMRVYLQDNIDIDSIFVYSCQCAYGYVIICMTEYSNSNHCNFKLDNINHR